MSIGTIYGVYKRVEGCDASVDCVLRVRLALPSTCLRSSELPYSTILIEAEEGVMLLCGAGPTACMHTYCALSLLATLICIFNDFDSIVNACSATLLRSRGARWWRRATASMAAPAAWC